MTYWAVLTPVPFDLGQIGFDIHPTRLEHNTETEYYVTFKSAFPGLERVDTVRSFLSAEPVGSSI